MDTPKNIFKDELVAKIKDRLFKAELSHYIFDLNIDFNNTLMLMASELDIYFDNIVEVVSVPDIDTSYFKNVKKIDKSKILNDLQKGNQIKGINILTKGEKDAI